MSLAKLAEQISEKRGRPFRIAIDISIWSVQNQAAGKGGKNPALRTLFFRLCRLLRLPIHPLFVFDGPNKPPFKRGAATSEMPAHIKEGLIQLLELFRFPYVEAPGEAEAECALLQCEGIVDAVLSEDVDTLAFGCTCFMREKKESGDRKYSNVSIYTSQAIMAGRSRLDREGMILFALMSGGDYNSGIPRCGPKVALEAARAGFGRDLLKLPKDDRSGINEWKERLQYELSTNESSYFETRHPGIIVPEWFPNRTVLDYYTNPAVSPLQALRAPIEQLDRRIDTRKLQEVTASLFRWSSKRFVKVFAPDLLSYRLRTEGPISLDGVAVTTDDPMVREIIGRRGDGESDAVTELRLDFLPLKVVGLELKDEPPRLGPEFQIDTDEDDDYANNSEVPSTAPSSPKKRKARPLYDPKEPQRGWFLEQCVRPGINDMIVAWEKKPAVTKPRAKKTVTDRNMKHGAILGYFPTSKAGLQKNSDPSINCERPKSIASSTASKPPPLAPHASKITKPVTRQQQPKARD